MDIGIVSMRYAKALMEYAKSMGAEDSLYQELCMLSTVASVNILICAMALDNPILTIKEKLALICTAAVGNGRCEPGICRFMTLVLRNRRENYLQYICLSYLDLYRKLKHIGVGKLITAVPVSQEVRERIEIVLLLCYMHRWSYKLKLILRLKVVLSLISTTSGWMPALPRN